MALPKIQAPLFDLTVPSTKKKVKFRPFTVKEEKILLIAQESKDIDQIILAIKQIINNCIEGIDVESLATFDMEYILIHLRAQSVGNEIEFKIKDPETEEAIEMSLDINDIKLHENKDHNPLIQISDDFYIKMRYPKLDMLKTLQNIEEKDKQIAMFNMMIECIDSVIQGEEVYQLKDFSKQEVDEFIESLTSQHVNMIKEFFDTMPVLRYEKEYKRSDGTTKTFVAEGTETFFI
jgi:hypothetical protein